PVLIGLGAAALLYILLSPGDLEAPAANTPSVRCPGHKPTTNPNLNMMGNIAVGEAIGAVLGAAGGVWRWARGIDSDVGATASEAAEHATPYAEDASSAVGRRRAPLKNAPYQPIRNAPETIGGRDYTGHALDQMQNRGLTPTVIENTINTGTASAGN